MKYAVHLSMFCNTWVDDISAYFPKLKEAGFDGVELSLFGSKEEDLKKMASKLHELDLEITCGSALSPEFDISSFDKNIREKGIEFLKSKLEFVDEIGATCLNGGLYAPWGISSLNGKGETWKRSADSINKIYASGISTKMNLEILNRFETNVLNTLDEGSKYLKLVESNHVKLLADTFHMNIEEDNISEAVSKNFSNIGIFHVSENHRGVPGSGHINFKDFFKTLSENNYDDFLTIESFVKANSEVAEALFTWRDLAVDPLADAINGLNYLKEIERSIKNMK